MNNLKRVLGLVWMLISPVAIFYLISTAYREIAKRPVIETIVQWGVFIAVFIPIAFGLVIFGYYALKGEYNTLNPD